MIEITPIRSVRSLLCLLLASILACGCATTPPQENVPDMMPSPFDALVPLPASIEILDGEPFRIGHDSTVIADGDDARPIGEWLANHLDVPRAPEGASRSDDASVRLRLGTVPEAGDEGYELEIGADGIEIVANGSAGLFYGVQTLRQLLPPALEYESALIGEQPAVAIPAARITDTPRFEWRGAMLDVVRHFFDVDDVKRYLDLMALYKLNRLHLHLSDDQGWRIEIESWPELTGVGAATEVGGTPGGYYTKEEFAEIVDYAAERFITIVPEIDMPGHTNAALASIPELNCDGVSPEPYTGVEVGFSVLCVDKEVTWRFIGDVVREIAAMTPGGYFHVGGDEVKKLGEEKYAAFIERLQSLVASHGKAVIGWDEIAAADLLPTTIVQHWRPGSFPEAAADQGAKIIFSPADRIYLDMKYGDETAIGHDWAAKIPVRASYEWDPVATTGPSRQDAILGVEAPLWTETVGNIRDLEYLAFPRLLSVAEIGWTPREQRSWEDFRLRL
ncbi:MAG: beta-N-acetylhexosaminidase, partial [Thermoanaerobaculia bacterium]|nr:beta-N-acetylhexosaminidase [Thermoanaerobaculia bacterium]